MTKQIKKRKKGIIYKCEIFWIYAREKKTKMEMKQDKAMRTSQIQATNVGTATGDLHWFCFL